MTEEWKGHTHVIVSSLSKGHLAGDEWMDLSRLLVEKKLINSEW